MDETLETVVLELETLIEPDIDLSSSFSADEPKVPEVLIEETPIKLVLEDDALDDPKIYVHHAVISYDDSGTQKKRVESVGFDETRVKLNVEVAESLVQELDLGQEGIKDPVKYAHIRTHRERLTEALKWQDSRAWWYFDHRIRPYGKR